MLNVQKLMLSSPVAKASDVVSWLVGSWFEPCHPLRIMSGLRQINEDDDHNTITNSIRWKAIDSEVTVVGEQWLVVIWLLGEQWSVVIWLLGEQWSAVIWLLGEQWSVVMWLLGEQWLVAIWLLGEQWLVAMWILGEQWSVVIWLLGE